jgi:hypothetical protein
MRLAAVAIMSLGCAFHPAPLAARSASDKPFTLSASARVRYERVDGQVRAGMPEDDEQLTTRVTVFAEYDAGPVRVGGEVYDSRAFLHEPGDALSANEVNALELVQAYVGTEIARPFGEGTSLALQAGRFTLNLGSRRLIAADDYRNTTNGYTGLRADLKLAGGMTANAIFVLPQTRLPDDRPALEGGRRATDSESFDLQLWGGYLARPRTLAGATLEIGYVGLFERDGPGRPTRDRNLDSFSARLLREPRPGAVDFELEGIYQTGTISTGTAPGAPSQDVAASFVHAEVGYTLARAARLRLSFEYDRASGDGPGSSYGRFDTLFGMRRAELAPSGIYNAVGRTNLETVALRAELAPGRNWDAFASYRPLWLAERTDSFSTSGVRDPTGASGRFAGHQIEGRFRYWLVKDLLRAEVNALWLGKGRFLKSAPNAPATGDTRYFTIGTTATF